MLYQLSYLAQAARYAETREISNCCFSVNFRLPSDPMPAGPPPQPEPPDDPPITAELLVNAYLQGFFPMADSARGQVGWYSPDPRAIIPVRPDDPLGGFRVRRSLAKRVRNAGFEIADDRAFREVMRACAAPRRDGLGTWISQPLIDAYGELHDCGLAHSVEAYRDGRLVGGLYGVALGGAFFGESMFSREKDSSQVCFVHLVERLRRRGFTLLDVQFHNDHLEQFGVVEVRRKHYLELLEQAVEAKVTW